MILSRCIPTRLRLQVGAHEEVVLEESEEVLAEVVVCVQCCVGEGRAVWIVLRAVVEWADAGTTNKDDTTQPC